MSQKQAVEVEVRELEEKDAQELLGLMREIYLQSDFLSMDESDVNHTVEEQRESLKNIYESANNTLLGAFVDGKLVGTAGIHASHQRRIFHIGEIGISIHQDYWNSGLGTLLMQDLIDWAKDSKVIRRLQLTVQKRNTRAVHVYEKMGFKTETIMERGAIDADGHFLDVHLMSLMID